MKATIQKIRLRLGRRATRPGIPARAVRPLPGIQSGPLAGPGCAPFQLRG